MNKVKQHWTFEKVGSNKLKASRIIILGKTKETESRLADASLHSAVKRGYMVYSLQSRPPPRARSFKSSSLSASTNHRTSSSSIVQLRGRHRQPLPLPPPAPLQRYWVNIIANYKRSNKAESSHQSDCKMKRINGKRPLKTLFFQAWELLVFSQSLIDCRKGFIFIIGPLDSVAIVSSSFLVLLYVIDMICWIYQRVCLLKEESESDCAFIAFLQSHSKYN